MKVQKIYTGIHTYSVGMTLTAKQYYRIKDQAQSHLRPKKQDHWRNAEKYHIDALEQSDIKLYLSRYDKLYFLKVRLEPCRVLESHDPSALYQPKKKSYQEMVQKVDELLKCCGIPKSIDQMKICREDITCDLYFDKSIMVDEYI